LQRRVPSNVHGRMACRDTGLNHRGYLFGANG
jgi:hypothetical protein